MRGVLRFLGTKKTALFSRRRVAVALAVFLTALTAVALVAGPKVRGFWRTWPRTRRLLDFLRNPQQHPDWLIPAQSRCGQAPFRFPTTGYVGYLWGDIFQPFHEHQGIDIFAGTQPGITPVYAAYDGYLTREANWVASVIIRHHDPLQPGRTIWTYYTHMADPEGRSFVQFPPNTHDLFVRQGTLLGYQGNYSGSRLRPTGVHLHFSIVLDDGHGHYRNELRIENTLDPSPYLGIPLNARRVPAQQMPRCPTTP